jgi:Ca-activated chloride channel family protein
MAAMPATTNCRPGGSRVLTSARDWVGLLLCLLLGTVAGAASDRTHDGLNPRRSPKDLSIERLLQLHHTHTEQVRLVLLPTSVTDRKGRIVRGLERKDFKLYEDHVPQEIRVFTTEAREPISIAFLLDVSGSMRQMDKLWHAKEAIRHFIDNLQPSDQFALICFADDQVAWVTDFTRDRRRFLRRLQVQDGYGQTALHDAVAAAPGLVDAEIKGRKAIVLITDGVDNFSQLSLDQAVEVARRVHLPIFTIGFLAVPESRLPKGTIIANLEMLRTVSRETGGRVFAVHDPDDLKEAVTALENELRFQYLIGYYPTRKRDDGQFHRIRVETHKRRHRVRARTGYYATP